LITNSKVEKV